MLTQKDLSQLSKLFQKSHKSLLKDLQKDLHVARRESTTDNIKFLKEIKGRIDELAPLLKKLARKQQILEKKMQAIEDYFEHRN